MTDVDVRPEAFPSKSRGVSGVTGGVATDVNLTSFADKILLTISQGGRLSQWVQVPLTRSAGRAVEMGLPGTSDSLLPSTHLTPKTILGGGGDDRETLGQLYAAQIASQIELRNPDDNRILVLGLGLEKATTEREAFFDLIDLVTKVL